MLGDGGVESPHPECAPFRVGTTRVSNPVCSPDFRASASVPFQWPAFASGVLQDINAFHRYTLHSDSPSQTRSGVVSSALSGLGPEISHLTRPAAYAPFTPSKSEQRSWPLYYRGCWHRVSRQFLLGYTQLRAIINSRSSLKLMSIKSGMPSSHLILCHPLFLLPPTPPNIRVFSNESALHFRWPKYWSFSFSISPSNEYSGLISFRMDRLDLLAVQGALKSLLQHHSSKASILRCSAFFIVQLSHPYMTTGKNHSFD